MSNGNGKKRPNTLIKIWKRDGGVCHLCGLLVPEPPALDAPVIARPTTDHLVSHVAGGGISQSNLKLAHKGCNELRGCEDLEDWKDLIATRGNFKQKYHGIRGKILAYLRKTEVISIEEKSS